MPNDQTSDRPSQTQPWLHQHGHEVQAFGTLRRFPIGLSAEARGYSCQRFNRILSDSQILYAQYKKHHWLMRGPTFYALRLLADKHATELQAWFLADHLVDTLSVRTDEQVRR